MLGIVVALPWELKTLTDKAIPAGTCKSLSDNLCVALAGIGSEHAYAAGELLLSQGATALLSWGCAAALDDRLEAGNILLPEHIIAATGEGYPVSGDWHQRLHQSLANRCSVQTGSLVESAAILKTPSEKRTLARRTGAIAADMESAAQARLAQERKVPFAAVRVVIDTASTDIPQNVMQSLDTNGEINIRKFFGNASLRPKDWIAVMKLGMQFNAARKTLKQTSRLVLDTSQIYLASISPRASTSPRG